MKTEEELSKESQPQYFTWLWRNKKTEILLTFVGIVSCILTTPIILDPMNENPIIVMILAFIAIYGFTVGMALQPYTIYKKLVNINYWSRDSPYYK